MTNKGGVIMIFKECMEYQLKDGLVCCDWFFVDDIKEILSGGYFNQYAFAGNTFLEALPQFLRAIDSHGYNQEKVVVRFKNLTEPVYTDFVFLSVLKEIYGMNKGEIEQ